MRVDSGGLSLRAVLSRLRPPVSTPARMNDPRSYRAITRRTDASGSESSRATKRVHCGVCSYGTLSTHCRTGTLMRGPMTRDEIQRARELRGVE